LPSSQAATFPWVSHALWFYSQMVRWGQVAFDPEHVAQVRATYRPDLYRLALATTTDVPCADTKIDVLFDSVRFDSDDLPAYLGQLSST
jgi:NitT/TauT family transport system ATP-binding protein